MKGKCFPFPLADASLICVCKGAFVSIKKENANQTLTYLHFAAKYLRTKQETGQGGKREGVSYGARQT